MSPSLDLMGLSTHHVQKDTEDTPDWFTIWRLDTLAYAENLVPVIVWSHDGLIPYWLGLAVCLHDSFTPTGASALNCDMLFSNGLSVI